MTKPLHTLLIAAALGSSMLAAHAEPRALIDTNMGKITVALNQQQAPQSVANFINYANKGFYNGTVFHRVINGFMIQGGGFSADMRQKETGKAITNEADNGLKNQKYTLAMARTAQPHSATSQFFINVADNAFLNHQNKTTQGWGYAVFGKVIEGTTVVDNIAKVPTSSRGYHENIPQKPVVINKITIVN